MLDLFQLLDNFHPYPAEQNGDILRSVSPGGNSCHSVLLDKDESCPTADLSNIGRPSGPACSTGELLNTPRSGYCAVQLSELFRCSHIYC